jgi:hypothetical protein
LRVILLSLLYQYEIVEINFYPNISTTGQGVIRAVHNLAWAFELHLIAVVVFFVSFNCDTRLVLTLLVISANNVLVHMNLSLHD